LNQVLQPIYKKGSEEKPHWDQGELTTEQQKGPGQTELNSRPGADQTSSCQLQLQTNKEDLMPGNQKENVA